MTGLLTLFCTGTSNNVSEGRDYPRTPSLFPFMTGAQPAECTVPVPNVCSGDGGGSWRSDNRFKQGNLQGACSPQKLGKEGPQTGTIVADFFYQRICYVMHLDDYSGCGNDWILDPH
jgi:hypothetical protein